MRGWGWVETLRVDVESISVMFNLCITWRGLYNVMLSL